eukprot:11295602-Alexandrium_andersonii.AAC.1
MRSAVRAATPRRAVSVGATALFATFKWEPRSLESQAHLNGLVCPSGTKAFCLLRSAGVEAKVQHLSVETLAPMAPK